LLKSQGESSRHDSILPLYQSKRPPIHFPRLYLR
jgi:hypothetical protein